MTRKQAFVLAIALTFIMGTIGASVMRGATPPSDGQIVKMQLIGARLEVEYAQIALAKTKSKDIREFAQRMVTDHTAAYDSVFALSSRDSIKGKTSRISVALMTGGAFNKAKLHLLNGPAFDRFYVDNEAKFHKKVIDVTTSVLVPAARNSELKSALQALQPMYQRHEEHALMLQADQVRTSMAKATTAAHNN